MSLGTVISRGQQRKYLSRSPACAYISLMPARKPPDPNAKPQIERFREMARQLECNEDEAAFDAVLRKIVTADRPKKYELRKQTPKADD